MRYSILGELDYGPWAPVIGYVLAVTSTVAMIALITRGPLRNWEVPDPGMIKIIGRLISFLGALFIVTGWFIAVPQNKILLLVIAGICLVVAVCLGLRYFLLIRQYGFEKEVANPDGKTVRIVPLLGGDETTDLAKAELERGRSIQEDILPGVAFDADKVWPRHSRIRVLKRVATAFILALALGPGGIAWLGFLVQVHLTGKPAAAVIHKKDAPGIEDIKIPKASKPQ